MSQPNNPREVPFQDQLNDASQWLELPGRLQNIGDAAASALDNNPGDNNLPSDQQRNAVPGTGSGGSIFDGIADAIREGLAPLGAVGGLSDKFTNLFLPTSIVRAVCGLGGVFFLLFGIGLLIREVRHDAAD